MNENQRMMIDALALEIFTAGSPEKRVMCWRLFADRYVTAMRDAHPTVTPDVIASMFFDACSAIEKRLSQLDAGAAVGCA